MARHYAGNMLLLSLLGAAAIGLAFMPTGCEPLDYDPSPQVWKMMDEKGIPRGPVPGDHAEPRRYESPAHQLTTPGRAL
jgi:hypothetical protein